MIKRSKNAVFSRFSYNFSMFRSMLIFYEKTVHAYFKYKQEQKVEKNEKKWKKGSATFAPNLGHFFFCLVVILVFLPLLPCQTIEIFFCQTDLFAHRQWWNTEKSFSARYYWKKNVMTFLFLFIYIWNKYFFYYFSILFVFLQDSPEKVEY